MSYGSTFVQPHKLVSEQQSVDLDAQNNKHLAPHNSRLHFGFIFISAVLCVSLGFSFFSTKQIPIAFTKEILSQPSKTTVTMKLTASNEYGSGFAVEYPWDIIVEPYRETTLTLTGVSSDQSEFYWKVDDQAFTTTVPQLVFVFKQTGFSEIEVSEILNGETLNSFTQSVMCKYVRREIRALNEEDLEDFFSAFEILNTYSTEEGQKLYGSKFFEKDFFNLQHLITSSSKDCDHWHGGPGFVGIHMAFTLQFEQALQSINPKIAVPYWDFVTDTEILGYDWRDSEVFDDDFFGTAKPNNDARIITEGRWAYWPVRKDASDYSELTNAYGLLRAPWDLNPAPYLTRSPTLYGVSDHYKPKACKEFYSCLQQTTWSDVADCLELDAHGNLHQALGGTWGGGFGKFLGMAILKDTVWGKDPINSFLTLGKALVKKMWRADYLICPESCDFGLSPDECTCSCSADKMEGKTAYDVLNEVGVLRALYGINEGKFIVRVSHDTYALEGLTDEEQVQVWQSLLEALCDPGVVGDNYGATSPNDITFWVQHQPMEKLWHLMRLSPTSYKFTWEDSDDNCAGHNSDDIPGLFAGLFDTNDANYNNIQLYNNLDPSNPDLPYVYDNLKWPICEELGYTMNNTA